MIYQRPIFGTLAAIFCFALGIISLVENPKAKTNRLFAIYNFSNGLWNMNELTVFMPHGDWSMFYYRFLSMWAAVLGPFFCHFIFHMTGMLERRKFRRALKLLYILGIAVAFLYLTPLIVRDLEYAPFQKAPIKELPGTLYWLFAFLIAFAPVAGGMAVLGAYRQATGTVRRQLDFLVLACVVAVPAVCSYAMSFTVVDLPWLYYPLQMMVGFVFAYAIFATNLIPASLALKRFSLIAAIYIVAIALLSPIAITLYQHMTLTGPSFLSLITGMILSGVILSVAPITYSNLIRRYTVFQEKTRSELTHELKTPLFAIQSANEFLMEQIRDSNIDPTKMSEYVQMIERNSNRLQQLVKNILDYSGLTDIGLRPKKRKFELRGSIFRAADQVAKLKSRLIVDVRPEFTVTGDPDLIAQVLVNLLSNASKFCPEGEIRVSAETKNQRTVTVICDKGEGCSSERLTKMFDIFYSESPKSDPNLKGSGLGLSIAKRIIEAHGGEIWAESDGVGKGTSVLFTLPT